MTPIWVLGAGGHAKVVIDALRATGAWAVAGVLDDDPACLGREVLGVPIRGDISAGAIARFGVEHAVIAIGGNRARAGVAGRLAGRVAWATVVHPRGHVAPTARVGEGAVILAGAVVQPDATIGRHAILNTSSSADHDCRVGDFAHLAPGVHLAGGVLVGAGALLGIGCAALPGRSVGAWATVGAGGVVVRDLPPGVTALGAPARPVGPGPAPDRPGR